jgi:hypothetical protein
MGLGGYERCSEAINIADLNSAIFMIRILVKQFYDLRRKVA